MLFSSSPTSLKRINQKEREVQVNVQDGQNVQLVLLLKDAQQQNSQLVSDPWTSKCSGTVGVSV